MSVPKLRFKEFDGDWINSDFSKASVQIIDGDRGFNYPKSDDFYDDEFCLFLNAGNVTKQGFNFENTQFISKNKDSSLRKGKLERNDLVITTRGTVGNVAYFNDSVSFNNMRINSGMVIARCQKNVLADFINQFLKSNLFEKWLDRNAFGSAQPQLTVKLLNSIGLSYPSKPEQTKIASFLSAVDKKISQLNQKHELLSQYKQGMMQKLFNQQIRFKADDGSEFGEWEENSLLELSEKAMYGMNASATEYDGKNKYLRITDICESSHKFKTDSLTSPNAELEEKYKLNLGDLLFARTGASVGKSYLYNPNDGITYFAGFLIKFSLKQDKVNPYFIFVQTLTKDFDKWVATNSMRSGQPGINAEEYSSYIFKIPCLEEQTKIANFLSRIDQKIEVVAQQIEQAKLWKKGLLQQMFV